MLLTAVIDAFSVTYMHRETGFLRFFLLLNLYSVGALLVLTAGSFDLLIGGWELVGMSSVMLIAFLNIVPAPCAMRSACSPLTGPAMSAFWSAHF